jgi:hypothetical protein
MLRLSLNYKLNFVRYPGPIEVFLQFCADAGENRCPHTQPASLLLPRGDMRLSGQGQAGHTQVILRSRAPYYCPEGTCAYLGKDKQDILR